MHELHLSSLQFSRGVHFSSLCYLLCLENVWSGFRCADQDRPCNWFTYSYFRFRSWILIFLIALFRHEESLTALCVGWFASDCGTPLLISTPQRLCLLFSNHFISYLQFTLERVLKFCWSGLYVGVMNDGYWWSATDIVAEKAEQEPWKSANEVVVIKNQASNLNVAST